MMRNVLFLATVSGSLLLGSSVVVRADDVVDDDQPFLHITNNRIPAPAPIVPTPMPAPAPIATAAPIAAPQAPVAQVPAPQASAQAQAQAQPQPQTQTPQPLAAPDLPPASPVSSSTPAVAVPLPAPVSVQAPPPSPVVAGAPPARSRPRPTVRAPASVPAGTAASDEDPAKAQVTLNSPHTAVPVNSTIVLEMGSGRLFDLAGPAASLFVADPKIAEARPSSPTSVFVFGVSAGQTTVAAVDQAGKSVGLYKVVVQPSTFGANQASQAVAKALPDHNITVKSISNGLELSGRAEDPAEAEHAVSAARAITSDKPLVDDRTTVAGPVQVLLRVRIAEMSRTVTRDLGLNWQNLSLNIGSAAQIGLATALPLADITGGTAPTVGGINFPKGHVEAILDALAEDQLVHVLAEPNLTAISGEPASFLVGGEFPIPVSQQQGETTITFKQYGISLAFVPTVISPSRISLHVRPEVSQLTDQGAVQLSSTNQSIVIPGLQIRRADTTIELGSGQSFAIAGLLSDSVTQTDNDVPFLGELPYFGALFRANSFKRQQSELVILVTPFIVRPVNDPATLQLPTSGKPPNDLERLLLLRQTARGQNGPEARISGEAGFIIQ